MRRFAFCVSFALPLLAQSNSELARLFDEDQKDRAAVREYTPPEQRRLATRDSQRRQRVTMLLSSGALRTGQDYERAAFIFQHGSDPSDYLRAHVLAMTAHALDAGRGVWLSAATLDRYLLSTGKAQVFGTHLSDTVPFERGFVPDSARTANCVPSLSDRDRLLQAVVKREPMPAITPCMPHPEKLRGTWSITERSAGGGFTHALLVIPSDEVGDMTLTENGKTTIVEDIVLVDRELRVRLPNREYVFNFGTETMTGVINRAGTGQATVVALHALR